MREWQRRQKLSIKRVEQSWCEYCISMFTAITVLFTGSPPTELWAQTHTHTQLKFNATAVSVVKVILICVCVIQGAKKSLCQVSSWKVVFLNKGKVCHWDSDTLFLVSMKNRNHSEWKYINKSLSFFSYYENRMAASSVSVCPQHFKHVQQTV